MYNRSEITQTSYVHIMTIIPFKNGMMYTYSYMQKFAHIYIYALMFIYIHIHTYKYIRVIMYIIS
jgi:hypothetical protein